MIVSNSMSFDNTVTLWATSNSSLTLSENDRDNGATTRSINIGGGNRIDFIIGRTESSENKGIISDRIVVRVDEILTDASPPYTPTKVSAYLVLVAPRRPDVTVPVVLRNLNRLLNFLLEASNEQAVDAGSILPRLLSGET